MQAYPLQSSLLGTVLQKMGGCPQQDHERRGQMYGLLVGSQVPMRLCPGFSELYPLGAQVPVEVLVQCGQYSFEFAFTRGLRCSVMVEVELCKGR